MLLSLKRAQTSVILRVKIRNSSVSTGAGLTGLTSASTGLRISTIADNEATPTSYTVAGATIETITTLGTFAAPTATKVRFKEVDATNHPGLYELQIADARFAVANAKSLLVTISGATNAAETDALVPLWDIDPYTANMRADIRQVNGVNTFSSHAGYLDVAAQFWGSVDVSLDVSNTYPVVVPASVDGLTYNSMMEAILAVVSGVATVSGSDISFKKRDGTTSKITVTVGGTPGQRTASVINS